MPHTSLRTLIAGVWCVVALTAGCGSPSQPSPPPPPASPGPLALSSIYPTSGSTFGTPVVRLLGTGFTANATVRIDGTLTAATVLTPRVITFKMPAHAAGPVDVVVTLATGESATLPGAYSYVQVNPPVITSIFPNVATTRGETWFEIAGTGFLEGAAVTLGELTPEIEMDGTSLYVHATAHAAGAVDVIVTNPDSQSSTIIGGYTFVPPGSLDFNGTWHGYATPVSASSQPLEFTIQGNVLISVSCGGRSGIALSPPPEVSEGQFSFRGTAGSINGSILSPAESEGRIDLPPCPNAPWYAQKR